MAFIGLAVGTIAGLVMAIWAYVVLGLPLLLCFAIHAFGGAAIAIVTTVILIFANSRALGPPGVASCHEEATSDRQEPVIS